MMNTKPIYNTNNKAPDPYRTARGLTLVEAAIAFVIIGLLMAGIVMGLSLVRNGALKSTYTHSRIYAQSLQAFIKQYNALPGDMSNARARLSACGDVNANACGNGDGNGVIGITNQNIYAPISTAGAAAESVLFWHHLQAANLVQAINLAAPLSDNSGWQINNPAAPAGGGFHIRTMDGRIAGAGGTPLRGIFLRWQNQPYINAASADGFVVSPKEAFYIDNKFDDGNPLAGTVQARGTIGALTANDGCRASESAYRQSAGDNKLCYMYFHIREAAGL